MKIQTTLAAVVCGLTLVALSIPARSISTVVLTQCSRFTRLELIRTLRDLGLSRYDRP